MPGMILKLRSILLQSPLESFWNWSFWSCLYFAHFLFLLEFFSSFFFIVPSLYFNLFVFFFVFFFFNSISIEISSINFYFFLELWDQETRLQPNAFFAWAWIRRAWSIIVLRLIKTRLNRRFTSRKCSGPSCLLLILRGSFSLALKVFIADGSLFSFLLYGWLTISVFHAFAFSLQLPGPLFSLV